jgi:hypothetical protein
MWSTCCSSGPADARQWQSAAAGIPPDPARRAIYDRDYRVLLAMHEQRRALDAIA